MNPVMNHKKEIETYQKQPSDDEGQYEVIDTVSFFENFFISNRYSFFYEFDVDNQTT